MFARRLALAAFAVLLSFGSAAAQDPTQLLPSEALPNWPAAPFWLLHQSMAGEKVNEAKALNPMAVYAVPTPPLPLVAINPCRIVDTRGNGFTGAYGPPALTQGAPRNFTLTGQCGISGASQAVSLNITVTNTQGPGFILIYPQDGAQPNVSTLNYVAGQTVANAAVVPLGTAGGITVIAGVSGTDLIIDTNGYYAPQTVVNTVNGLSGDLTLAAGSNITITPSGNTLTIATDPIIVFNPLSELTGVTGWDCVSPSDRNVKRNIVPVDGRDALARLVALPIQTWSYFDQSPEVRHMGPMAQDFAGAYALGADDRKINPLDANGVALAAIQGLYAVVEEKEREIEELKARLSKLEDRLDQ